MMTIKRSSSQRASPGRPTTPTVLVDSAGQSFRPGELIGRGGEGSVFTVEGEPLLAVKLYHQAPLAREMLDKLGAMISCRSPAIDSFSAWPQAVLYQAPNSGPCGMMMPRIDGSRPLHELYGTSTRRRQFPGAQWHHLLLAARNVAAAFETLHGAGIVVGDVNQGNLLVDQQMCVRFIDCDSFQITHEGRTFVCRVGTPHFTPPELQSVKLSETLRSPHHDRFGLAVLLFHLLFVGRHPFAGRFYGTGELHIEKAIAERRFAFSRDRAATLVEPPPASLLLSDIPPALEALFEQAFRGPADQRPTAHQWAHELESLLRQRKTCAYDTAHVYYAALRECPWCRIEDEGGPAFFVLGDSAVTMPSERLDHLEERIGRLTTPSFPQLEPQRFSVPQILRPKRRSGRVKISTPDLAATLLAASVILSLLAPASLWFLAAGALAAAVSAGWLLLGPKCRSRRDRVAQLMKQLEKRQQDLQAMSRIIRANHRHRQGAYEQSLAEIRSKYEQYYAADTSLEDVLVVHRISELHRFLSRNLIQDHVARIPNLSYSLASVLQSYGIESAADVDSLKLIGIPMLTPGLTMELVDWREKLERQFEFKPDHGVMFRDAHLAGDAAVRRFKTVQARSILMAAKQLDSMATAAGAQSAREVAQYEATSSQAMQVAVELRDFQSDRLMLERLLNSSPVVILGAVAGGLVAGAFLRLLFGW